MKLNRVVSFIREYVIYARPMQEIANDNDVTIETVADVLRMYGFTDLDKSRGLYEKYCAIFDESYLNNAITAYCMDYNQGEADSLESYLRNESSQKYGGYSNAYILDIVTFIGVALVFLFRKQIVAFILAVFGAVTNTVLFILKAIFFVVILVLLVRIIFRVLLIRKNRDLSFSDKVKLFFKGSKYTKPSIIDTTFKDVKLTKEEVIEKVIEHKGMYLYTEQKEKYLNGEDITLYYEFIQSRADMMYDCALTVDEISEYINKRMEG